MLKKTQFAVIAVLASVLGAMDSASAAGGPDLSALTGSVDYTTVIAAVLSIAGLLAAVYLAMSGSKKVLQMLRGA